MPHGCGQRSSRLDGIRFVHIPVDRVDPDLADLNVIALSPGTEHDQEPSLGVVPGSEGSDLIDIRSCESRRDTILDVADCFALVEYKVRVECSGLCPPQGTALLVYVPIGGEFLLQESSNSILNSLRRAEQERTAWDRAVQNGCPLARQQHARESCGISVVLGSDIS